MIVLRNLESVLKLRKVDKFCFVEFQRLIFKFISKNIDNIPQNMEDQPRYNLQYKFNNLNQLL